MTCRDYSVCTENEGGKHGPVVRNDEDYSLNPAFVGVRCAACGETTGQEIARFVDDLDWG